MSTCFIRTVRLRIIRGRTGLRILQVSIWSRQNWLLDNTWQTKVALGAETTFKHVAKNIKFWKKKKFQDNIKNPCSARYMPGTLSTLLLQEHTGFTELWPTEATFWTITAQVWEPSVCYNVFLYFSYSILPPIRLEAPLARQHMPHQEYPSWKGCDQQTEETNGSHKTIAKPNMLAVAN